VWQSSKRTRLVLVFPCRLLKGLAPVYEPAEGLCVLDSQTTVTHTLEADERRFNAPPFSSAGGLTASRGRSDHLCKPVSPSWWYTKQLDLTWINLLPPITGHPPPPHQTTSLETVSTTITTTATTPTRISSSPPWP